MDGVEERVPTGVYRNTSTAARVKKERIVLERDRGPRSEARDEEKHKAREAVAWYLAEEARVRAWKPHTSLFKTRGTYQDAHF